MFKYSKKDKPELISGVGLGPITIGMQVEDLFQLLGESETKRSLRQQVNEIEKNLNISLPNPPPTTSFMFENNNSYVSIEDNLVNYVEARGRRNVTYKGVLLCNRPYTRILKDLAKKDCCTFLVASEGLVDETRSAYLWSNEMADLSEMKKTSWLSKKINGTGVVLTAGTGAPGMHSDTSFDII